MIGITILGLVAAIGFVWSFAGIARMKSSDLDIPKVFFSLCLLEIRN